ncbi:hypothetical protein BBP40_003108 [Aspergillus hancockii]|nr:hypothetical protein BBP40_003108 [Aspergillus hancockii]
MQDDILKALTPLLPSDQQHFEKDLRQFLCDARDLWTKMQRSSKWVTTTANLAVCARARRSGYDKESDLQGPPIMALFPHFISSDKSQPLYSGCMVWPDKEVAKGDLRKRLAGERTTVTDSKALVVREAPQNPHIISKSRRQGKSFAEHLTARMSDEPQNRANRLSREDESSK